MREPRTEDDHGMRWSARRRSPAWRAAAASTELATDAVGGDSEERQRAAQLGHRDALGVGDDAHRRDDVLAFDDRHGNRA